MVKKRELGIDVIKCLAVVLVIAVHHFSALGLYENKQAFTLQNIIILMVYQLTLIGVPLFLISSGYLLRYREITRNHFSKSTFFLINVFLIYLVGTAFRLIINKSFTVSERTKESIKRFLSPTYYVGLYISLYLIFPFLNKLFNCLNELKRKLFLIIVISIISLPEILNLIPYVSFLILNQEKFGP